MDLYQTLLLVSKIENGIVQAEARLRRADKAIRRSNELIAQSERLLRQRPSERVLASGETAETKGEAQ